MSAPKASTSPATPRKDAAERYSPPIALALRAGRTVREATKKSDVVRLNLSPQMPIPTVSTETTRTATAPKVRLTGSPPVGEIDHPPSRDPVTSLPLDHVGEGALVAL